MQLLKGSLMLCVSGALFCAPLLPKRLGWAQESPLVTHEDVSSRTFVTQGSVSFRSPYAKVTEILKDCALYPEWALKDINKDYETKGYLVLMNHVGCAPKSTEDLEARFELNLPWPLNLKDLFVVLKKQKETYEDITSLQPAAIKTEKMILSYKMPQPGVALSDFLIGLEWEGNAQQSTLNFKVQMQLTRLVKPFFSKQKYLKNVEVRMAQVLKNLEIILNEPGTNVPGKRMP